MQLTQDEFKQLFKDAHQEAPSTNPRGKTRARGRRKQKQQGVMNDLERSYAEHLKLRQAAGEVLDFRYEEFKLTLAKGCTIKVDFAVLMADGHVEFHECKGYMEEDARVKLLWVSQKCWWFPFFLVKANPKKNGGGFSVTEIGA